MTRLCPDGVATFVILDHDPLYSQDDIIQIAHTHAIKPEQRNALWRLLEQAGRAYLDQRRLVTQPARLTRVRQDLELARRLATQLQSLTPESGQAKTDTVSVGLSRMHLSALREGERRVGAVGPTSLDEARAAVSWLADVYEHALGACSDPGDPEARWRSALVQFYTHGLARSWAGPDGAGGEAFLADCRQVLENSDGSIPRADPSPDLAGAKS